VVARVSGAGDLRVAPAATALEVALALASLLAGLSAAASGHSPI
jgi:hypothetical protein